MGIAPWSTSVALTWKPSLRYFRQRYDLLGDVEASVGIRSYDFSTEVVVARLEAPGWAELVVRDDGLGLHRRLPEGGWDELVQAARLLLEAIGPQANVHVDVFNQYLLELPDVSYDEARRQCGERFAGPWMAEIGTTDWAYLLDGKVDGLDYQIEFGILERREIPMRLTRSVGRSTGPPADLHELLREVQPEDLPAVAFFSDFTWKRARVAVDEDLTDHCVRLIDQSTSIVAKLFDVATTDSNNGNTRLAIG